jgi:hypothetical protein
MYVRTCKLSLPAMLHAAVIYKWENYRRGPATAELKAKEVLRMRSRV